MQLSKSKNVNNALNKNYLVFVVGLNRNSFNLYTPVDQLARSSDRLSEEFVGSSPIRSALVVRKDYAPCA